MDIAGLFLAILIGLSLGLIGGGGSILTIPVLVYVVGLNPVISTSYSLFVVGSTSLIGAYNFFVKKQIDIKASIVFSLPSLLVVLVTRKYLFPAVPNEFYLYSLHLTKDFLIMVVFAGLMLFSSISMIRQQQVFLKLGRESEQKSSLSYPLLFFEGIIVGLLTGFLGAGGGFLIIPALVLFAKIPMKTAIGTSLLIIAINSLTGFCGDLMKGVLIDWYFLLGFTCFAIAGIILGSYLSGFIQGSRLKPAFGWFTLLMGVFIIVKELVRMY